MYIKRLIGWLAEFFPEHNFYSSDFGKNMNLTMKSGEQEAHETDLTTALLVVCVGASSILKQEGQQASVTFTGCTSSGKDIGNFKVTVERVE